MIMCLDVGNTHIYGGVFKSKDILFQFRYPSDASITSDTLGVFLTEVLEKNKFDASLLEGVVMSSVVPALDYSVVSACKKYFSITPMLLKPGIKTGIKLDLKNPLELGADRIADAMAALDFFPAKNLLVVDFGTATTICAVSEERVYLGGAILAGVKTSMKALTSKAAKLADFDIVKPSSALGRTTISNLQSGMYYGQLGAIKEIVNQINASVFPNKEACVISTGGYGQLFQGESFFYKHVPDLVLHGLRLIWEKNK